MTGFDRRTLQRIMVAVELKLIIGSDYVTGITRDVSKKGLCIDIPTASLKSGMLDKLNERVVMYLGDLILYGLVIWYDVDNGFFKVGITLERGSQGKWWDVIGPKTESREDTD
jgi:hypothetical protein